MHFFSTILDFILQTAISHPGNIHLHFFSGSSLRLHALFKSYVDEENFVENDNKLVLIFKFNYFYFCIFTVGNRQIIICNWTEISV